MKPILYLKQLLIFFAFYLLVALFNDGFMALDEYWVGITRYIPAQTSDMMHLVGDDDVKSPMQMLPMHAVAQASLQLGLQSPYLQYRSVIFVLAFISILIYALALFEFCNHVPADAEQSKFLILMMAFYFGGAFALTRPMYESVAAPWLFYSAVKAYRYNLDKDLKSLLWGVFLGSVAFCLRPQLGFCALIFVVLPIMQKRWKDLVVVAAVGALFLGLSGLPDLWLRGKWHHSLLQLTVYNYQHGADYGNKPVTFYPLMFIVLSLSPFLIRKFTWDQTKRHFTQFKVFWIMVGLFTFLHSLFPQKWERFMISMIPFIVVLVWPMLWSYHKNWRHHKIRLGLIYSLNFLILGISSFFPAQKNLIDMSLFLNENPTITTVYRYDDTPGWITEVFIRDRKIKFVEATIDSIAENKWDNCSEVLVLGQPHYEEITNLDTSANILKNLKQIATFKVNLIEALSYKLNPKHNRRRVNLKIFTGQSCPNKIL